MTQEKFQFDLVSPEKILVSEPISHVVLPSVDGEMGVGVNHEKYLVALKEGEIKLYRGSHTDAPEIIAIGGGFADITGDSCTVLAENIVAAD